MDVIAEMAHVIVKLPKLCTFAASEGYADDAAGVLRDKLGAGFVIEDEDGDDYLLGGIEGITKRTI